MNSKEESKDHHSNFTNKVRVFLKEQGLHKIVAFSGGADEELEGVDDPSLKERYKKISLDRQEQVIRDVMRKLQTYRIAILTGGTKWGLPKTATTVARELKLKTIGVFPLAGRDKVLFEALDLTLEVTPLYGESRWGDESPLFANLLDGVIVYGGSAGTLTEMAHILKINEKLIKDVREPKFIVPISGTGGVADGLPFIWAKPDVRAKSMPAKRVVSGKEAADIIIDKLSLEDFTTLE